MCFFSAQQGEDQLISSTPPLNMQRLEIIPSAHSAATSLTTASLAASCTRAGMRARQGPGLTLHCPFCFAQVRHHQSGVGVTDTLRHVC